MPRFMDRLFIHFVLKMCRSKVGMVVILVPPEAHRIIGPLHALDVCPFSRSP